MWKHSTTIFALEHFGDASELVLNILGLLNQGSFHTISPSALNGISQTHCLPFDSIGWKWQVRWNMYIVINKQAVFVSLSQMDADKLSNDLASDWDPNMVDAKLHTHIFSVI